LFVDQAGIELHAAWPIIQAWLKKRSIRVRVNCSWTPPRFRVSRLEARVLISDPEPIDVPLDPASRWAQCGDVEKLIAELDMHIVHMHTHEAWRASFPRNYA
jgi:hypothetical protein